MLDIERRQQATELDSSHTSVSIKARMSLRERARRSSRSYCPGKNGKDKTVCRASSITIIIRDRSLYAFLSQLTDFVLGTTKSRRNIQQVRAIRIILDPVLSVYREEISLHGTCPIPWEHAF
jgi:hypothetical protein